MKRNLLSSALAIMFHAPLAVAQTAAPTQTEAATQPRVTEQIDKIEVTDKKRIAPSDVSLQSAALPSKVTTIDRDEIERTNIGRDIANVLRRVPGIMAHNLNQGDTGTSIKMRGFLTATHGADAAVTIDGAAQNVPSAIINHGMNDLSWLAPEMIERIEVIKGPFSALYGDQNRSGALNIITRSAGATAVGFSVGSFGAARISGVYSGMLGNVQTFIVADHFEQDGYRDNSDMRRSNLMVKGSIVGPDGGRWALRANTQKSRWNGAGFLNINRLRAGLDREKSRDPLGPPLSGTAERSSIIATRTPFDSDAGLHLTAFLEDYARRRITAANLNNLNVADDERAIFGARALYNLNFGGAGALALGLDLRNDRGDAISQRWLAGVPSLNFNANQDLDLLTYGMFAQGQIKVTEAVKIVGGMRLDTFDYDIKNRKLPAASLAYKKTISTPRIGLVWSPSTAFNLFANTGQGFRSPGQAELSPSGATSPLGALGGASNPQVQPSKVKSYDVGFRSVIAPQWTAGGALYHTVNQNEIIQISPDVFASVGDVTRDGWELDTRFAASDSFSVYASFGKISKATINNPLPNAASRISVPPKTLKVGASHSQALNKGLLVLNADAFYISGIPFFEGTPLTLAFARPYSKYDLRASYESDNWQLTASLTLQPHKYSSEVAFGSAAGLLIDPRPKSEASIALRYKF